MSIIPTEVPLPRSLVGWVPYVWNRLLFPETPEADRSIRLAHALLVLLLPAMLLYPVRGFYLFEPDEGRYAQIPKEMVDRGSWIVPTLQGEPYLDKPPLMYWLIGLSYRAFGTTEAAARLIPAICVHLTILLVYLIGRRSIGERGAFWAAMLLSVAPGYLSVARLLLLDGLLTLCVTASVLCGFEAVRTGRLLLRWWVAAAIFSGLGFLTKGPISEILLFPPLVAFAWLSRSTTQIRWYHAALFAGIVAGVNIPWYVGIYFQQPEFLKHFFWDHNVMRFLQPFDHLQPVWYYVPIILGGFLPGIIVAIGYGRSLMLGESAETRTRAGGFWLLAGLWCVAFFSVSGSKLPTYILPAFPPLCLALGEYMSRSWWDRARATRLLLGSFATLLMVGHFVAIPWYAKARSPMGESDVVAKYVSDPNVPVLTYPRNCDSVAFYTGRSDLQRVRTKDLNQAIVDCHFRPRTVFLFTHNHSLQGFREALPPSLKIVETATMRKPGTAIEKALNTVPWGLCDIAVVEPVVLQHRAP